MIAAVAGAGWLVRTAAGRRAGILLVAPLYPALMPFHPAYGEDTLSRVLIAMIAVPVTVFAAAALVFVLLERLVIRAAFVSGVDAGRAAGTRAD
jgi:hypothetical protein